MYTIEDWKKDRVTAFEKLQRGNFADLQALIPKGKDFEAIADDRWTGDEYLVAAKFVGSIEEIVTVEEGVETQSAVVFKDRVEGAVVQLECHRAYAVNNVYMITFKWMDPETGEMWPLFVHNYSPRTMWAITELAKSRRAYFWNDAKEGKALYDLCCKENCGFGDTLCFNREGDIVEHGDHTAEENKLVNAPNGVLEFARELLKCYLDTWGEVTSVYSGDTACTKRTDRYFKFDGNTVPVYAVACDRDGNVL